MFNVETEHIDIKVHFIKDVIAYGISIAKKYFYNK